MVNAGATWLGKPESERLEFKSAQALKHRETIVRAVVALLNHKGGNVIVGADDRGWPEGHESLQHEVDSLQSTLIDSIEPRPLSAVAVKAEATPHGEVLNVTVKGKRPTGPFFAERRNGMYGFWIRSGPTTRSLTPMEIGAVPSRDRRARQWKRWDAPLIDRNEGAITFVLQAEIADQLDLGTLARLFAPEKRALLSRRNMVWTVVSDYDSVERVGRRLESGSPGARKWLSCDSRTGLVRFEGSADFLKWRAPDAIKEPVIYPLPLVEGVASFFWLLQEYASEAKPEDALHVQLGLWRPGGYRLGPHRPESVSWQWPTRWTAAHDNTSIEKAVDLGWHELGDDDRVARGFVTYVYEDFGYDETAVPFWNEGEGRFEFPK